MMNKKFKTIYKYLIAIILLSVLTMAIIVFRKPIEMPDEKDLLYGRVTYVIDGDTIKFQVQKDQSFLMTSKDGDEPKEKTIPEGFDLEGENIIRLIGIDAPESASYDSSKNTEEGLRATEFVKELIEGKTVGLEFDKETRDKYDRFLAYVWMDGELINRTIYKSEHAELMMISPNTKYEEYFLEED